MPLSHYAGDTRVSCWVTDDESITDISNDIGVAEIFVTVMCRGECGAGRLVRE